MVYQIRVEKSTLRLPGLKAELAPHHSGAGLGAAEWVKTIIINHNGAFSRQVSVLPKLYNAVLL